LPPLAWSNFSLPPLPHKYETPLAISN